MRSLYRSMPLLIIIGLMASQLVSAQSNYFYNQPFSLSGHNADTGLCYYTAPESIYDALDNTVYITITVMSGRVDFYVLTAGEYHQFTNGIANTKASSCAVVAPQSWESRVESIGFVYSGTYVAPDNAYHYFVLYDPYPADTNGLLSLAWANSAPTTTQAAYTPYTYEQATQSIPITTAQETGVGFAWGFTYLLWMAAIALAIAVFVYFVYLPWSRKAKATQTKLDSVLTKKEPPPRPKATPRKVTPETVASPPAKISADMMFCRECGARISRDSKFCKECGSKLS